jgi:hypothetical protein
VTPRQDVNKTVIGAAGTLQFGQICAAVRQNAAVWNGKVFRASGDESRDAARRRMPRGGAQDRP